MPALAVIAIGGDAGQWEWPASPTTGGLASVETLRADQAPIGDANGVQARLDAVGRLGHVDGGEWDGRTLPELRSPALSTVDLVPTATPTPTSEAIVTVATVSPPHELQPALSEAEMRDVLTTAGWPVELHDQALAVSFCESKWNPGAIGDGGSSVGLFQLSWSGSSWRGWFIAAGEDEAYRLDPVVNARTALYAYNRSSWAPWTCAALNGIE